MRMTVFVKKIPTELWPLYTSVPYLIPQRYLSSLYIPAYTCWCFAWSRERKSIIHHDYLDIDINIVKQSQKTIQRIKVYTRWRHQMETFFALLALCAGNSSVTGQFPSQKQVTQSFDVFFDRRMNKWLSKQSRRRWFETPSRSFRRHCNEISHP